MADDGSGRDITIPSFLLFKHDADVFKQTIIDTGTPMRIEMSFPSASLTYQDDEPYMPADSWRESNPDERHGHIPVDLWMSPFDYHSKFFLRHFRSMADAFESCIAFKPHMYIIDGEYSACVGRAKQYEYSHISGSAEENEEEEEQDWTNLPCYNLCTNGGRYCAGDPDGTLGNGITGGDVVAESLRELCIWSYYGPSSDPKGNGELDRRGEHLWWNYIANFIDGCEEAAKTSRHELELCANEAMKKAGIDKDVVDQCISNSGGLTTSDHNNKLDTEVALQRKENIFMLPTLRVHGRNFDRSLEELFHNICNMCGLEQSPGVCRSCAYCPDIAGCVAHGGKCPSGVTTTTISGTVSSSKKSSDNHHTFFDSRNSKPTGVSLSTFLSSFFIVTALMLLAGFVHYKRTRHEAREHIRSILADYMPLTDDGNAFPDTSVHGRFPGAMCTIDDTTYRFNESICLDS